MALVERALPGMRERGFGRILSVSSTALGEPIRSSSSGMRTAPGLLATFWTLARQVASDGVTPKHDSARLDSYRPDV